MFSQNMIRKAGAFGIVITTLGLSAAGAGSPPVTKIFEAPAPAILQVVAHADEIFFTPLNDPQQGPGGTNSNAINDLGVVAGNYASGSVSGVHYGFVSTPPYSKESFAKVEVTGAGLTNIFGINLAGTVTGFSRDTSGVYHGFVSYPPYDAVTSFDAPGACSSGAACANSGTFAISINLEGVIAGYYADANGVTHGFVSHPPHTHFTTIDAPGACSSGAGCSGLGTLMFEGALNDFGAITGYYLDASGVAHGFASQSPYTHFTTIDAPGACSSDSNPACFNGGTQSVGINLSGVITGAYYDAEGVGHGFVSYPPYTTTTFTSFDPAGSIDTIPTRINAEGVVVGFSYDASIVTHGFVSHPPYTAVATFDAPGACSTDSNPGCAFNGTFVFGVNVEGEFTGFAADAAGNSHGFVARQ
jgi:hypothetical protein